MSKKLTIRWSRGAGKAMRSKLRKAGIRVSEVDGPIQARLELVVEVEGREARVPIPIDYVLLSSADWAATEGSGHALE